MNRKNLLWAASLLACGVLASGYLALPARAAISDAQKQQLAAAEEKLSQVSKLVVARDHDGALKLVVEVQTTLAPLSADKDADVQKQVSPLMTRLNSARRVLESRGVKVPPMPEVASTPAPRPGAPTPRPTTPTPGTPTPTPTTPTGAVSFSKDVAPMIMARCRGCHVTGNRGNFSMASYDALMRGARGTEMVTPGKGKDSRLVEVLESGDMPQGGRPFAPAEIALISKWIDEGAKFDGPDRNAPLATLVPTMDRTRLDVAQATGRESIKFSRDIAPVLAETCTNCHGGTMPSARLGVDTFRNLLNGSQDNVVIVPGKPAESLLIKKIKGEAGARMPLRGTPLSAETIANFEKWIAEGARFDGDDPTMQTEMVAAIYQVSQMTHEQLAEKRVDIAKSNWRLGNPDEAPELVETDNFLIVGNVGEDRLREVGRQAEAQLPKVATIFGASQKPLFKGRMTIFAFDKSYDYSEFGQMVEKREIPSGWRGHWRYTVVDNYAGVYPPRSDSEGKLDTLLAEQIAGAYIETQGKFPRWFTQGSAWAVAARMSPKDARIVRWNDMVAPAAARMTAPDDFLTGKVSPDAAAVLNYSFCSSMMANKAAYNRLIELVHGGTSFDNALQQTFRADAKTLAGRWAPRAGKR